MNGGDAQVRDRRRSARHAVRDVRGTLHLSADAKIMNMGLTGMAVETDVQLRVGRNYSFSIRHSDSEPLRLSGTVVWCHLRGLRRSETSETRTVYEAGFSFDEALSEPAGDLARILQATAVIAVEKRICGRFKVDLPEPVNLNVTYPFVVKTISAVGILIETEISPALESVIDVDLDLENFMLRTKGRIAHAGETVDPEGGTRSLLGVEFLELSSGDRRAVAEFIGHRLSAGSGSLA